MLSKLFAMVPITPVVGPRLVPKIEMISPGETGPGAPLAALVTVVGSGVDAGVTTSVTARACGLLPAPAAVTATVPV